MTDFPHNLPSATYKGYRFSYNPKPIPSSAHDWDFWHEDYDGGDVDWDTPSRDPRAGTGSSIPDCMGQIDEIEAEEESSSTKVYTSGAQFLESFFGEKKEN